MEHEAREARPIGAQGAFVSNSMHYIYTPAPFTAPSIPGYTRRLANRETLPAHPAKYPSIRSLRSWISISSIALRFDPPESDLRNLSRRLTVDEGKSDSFLARVRTRLIRIATIVEEKDIKI